MVKSNASRSLRVRPLALVAAVAVAVAAAAQPAHADPGFPQVSSVHVKFSLVDLSTAAGQEAARERIEKAARVACQRVEDELDLSRHSNYLKCVTATLSQTMPQLAELISRQSQVKMVSNTTK